MERMNKMKRKVLSYILVMLIAFVLVGCGDTSEKSTSEGTTNTSGTKNDKTSKKVPHPLRHLFWYYSSVFSTGVSVSSVLPY